MVGRTALGVFLVLIAAAVVGVWVILGVEEGQVAVTAARIVAVLVLLLISLDLLVSRALAWLSPAGVAHDVVSAFDRSTTDEVSGALSVVTDYSVATATAPPIPDWVYRLRKNRLEAAWQGGRNLGGR